MAQNQDCKNDQWLEHDLKLHANQNLKRVEIIDYMKRDQNWSLRTFARRLKEFGITYINHETSVDDAKEAVKKEINGPGKFLGYRAMNQKLRTEYSIHVPHHLVHNVMRDVDPEGIAARQVNKKIKKHKQPFTSEGPLGVVSLDSHDKLCGYQNSSFPPDVYGCLDIFSRKVLFLFLSFSNSQPETCFSNSEPQFIGKNYLKRLSKSKLLPYFLRADGSTETGEMCSIHDPLDSIKYDPSTSNKTERF